MVWSCGNTGRSKDVEEEIGIAHFEERDITDPEQDGLARYWKTPRRQERAGNN
jgi:hypothetical protein